MSEQTLRLESGRKPGHVVDGALPSATTELTLVIFEMAKADNFSLHLIWAALVSGAFKVYASNAYNPNPNETQATIDGVPPDETTALNPGHWVDVTSEFTIDDSPAGSAGATRIHGQFIEDAWLKVTIVPDMGGGTRTIAHHSSDAVVNSTKTWTLGNGAFSAADVGATIVVSGDTGTNPANGTYVIASVTNATTIVTTTGPGADETLGASTSVHLAVVAATIDGYISGKSL